MKSTVNNKSYNVNKGLRYCCSFFYDAMLEIFKKTRLGVWFEGGK